jgi:hypothetical protein
VIKIVQIIANDPGKTFVVVLGPERKLLKYKLLILNFSQISKRSKQAAKSKIIEN